MKKLFQCGEAEVLWLSDHILYPRALFVFQERYAVAFPVRGLAPYVWSAVAKVAHDMRWGMHNETYLARLRLFLESEPKLGFDCRKHWVKSSKPKPMPPDLRELLEEARAGLALEML